MSETTANQTVNALFEINASNNHGLNFQFDEVVRSKAKRRHLEAEDCECCRDYYNAMGPLPPRLVPPLWNSLSSSRVKPLQSNDEHAESQADHELIERHPTEEHMRQISRHRHEWTRAATPPDYWTIGFPTTQEAENINKKAEDMHQQKRRRMENEASKQHGRFKKRL
ncbi:hypothetical protein BD410DRAFT_413230 [Rickenella mellea]|uniref:DNA endonuclease activator Ctp1 C-terminal domain-containing protein n=1 Tax=Rickenella mellea TaxID=50990 RepID=A0A4Y7QJ69_9AGAM|nr:hypothetical protein BD410DRAFT_413230 [Rickenella mellea]